MKNIVKIRDGGKSKEEWLSIVSYAGMVEMRRLNCDQRLSENLAGIARFRIGVNFQVYDENLLVCDDQIWVFFLPFDKKFAGDIIKYVRRVNLGKVIDCTNRDGYGYGL